MYLSGVSFTNSGSVQVMCRPEGNYDMFIHQFLNMHAAAALWPRIFTRIREEIPCI
jgi:hypothetical protein